MRRPIQRGLDPRPQLFGKQHQRAVAIKARLSRKIRARHNDDEDIGHPADRALGKTAQADQAGAKLGDHPCTEGRGVRPPRLKAGECRQDLGPERKSREAGLQLVPGGGKGVGQLSDLIGDGGAEQPQAADHAPEYQDRGDEQRPTISQSRPSPDRLSHAAQDDGDEDGAEDQEQNVHPPPQQQRQPRQGDRDDDPLDVFGQA